jgi:hypothetical protein
MNRRFPSQTLQCETDSVVDEPLYVCWVELIERERLDARSRGG